MSSKHLWYFFFWGIMTLFLTACPIKNERPIQAIAPVHLPQLPLSTIQVPVSISAAKLKRFVEGRLPHPLAKGESQVFDMQLAGQEKQQEDKSLWEYLTQPIFKWVDRTFEVQSKLLYEVSMDDLDFRFVGNKIIVTANLKMATAVKVVNGLNVFGEQIRLNGSLRCPVAAKMKLGGEVAINKAAEVKIHLDANESRLQVTNVCSSRTLRRVEFPKLIKPILQPIVDKIRQKINQLLTTQVQHVLNHHKDDLSFRHQINQTAQYLSQPFELQDSVWLVPHLQEVFVSPIEGRGEGVNNKLHLSIGIHAKPEVLLQAQAPSVTIPSTVDFSIKRLGNAVNVYVNGKLPLDDAAVQLQTYLKDYVDTYYAKKGYTIGEVELYPSNNKVVVAIEVLRARSGKHKAHLYLWGVPKYDVQQQQIYLDDLRFTAQTKDVALKFARWIMHPTIMKRLRANTRFDASEDLAEIQRQLNAFVIEEEFGRLTGRFEDVTLRKVFVSASHFEVFLQAKGKLELDLRW